MKYLSKYLVEWAFNAVKRRQAESAVSPSGHHGWGSSLKAGWILPERSARATSLRARGQAPGAILSSNYPANRVGCCSKAGKGQACSLWRVRSEEKTDSTDRCTTTFTFISSSIPLLFTRYNKLIQPFYPTDRQIGLLQLLEENRFSLLAICETISRKVVLIQIMSTFMRGDDPCSFVE